MKHSVSSRDSKLETQIALGVVKQVQLGERSSRLIILCQETLCEVTVSSQIFGEVTVKDLEGTNVICATCYSEMEDGFPCPPFIDHLEVVHLVDGPMAGRTLTYSRT